MKKHDLALRIIDLELHRFGNPEYAVYRIMEEPTIKCSEKQARAALDSIRRE